MRPVTLALTLTATLFLTGCSKLVSVNPFLTGKEAKVDPALIGVWRDSDDEDTLIVKEAGSHYALTYLDKSSSVMKFDAWLLEAGDAKLVDLVTANDDPFQIPAHVPMRIWLQGDTLRIAFLDSDWIKEQAVQRLGAQAAEDRTLITVPSDTARAFLLKYGTDDRAPGEPEALHRVQ